MRPWNPLYPWNPMAAGRAAPSDMIPREQYEFVSIPEDDLVLSDGVVVPAPVIDGGVYPLRDAARRNVLRAEDLCFLYEGACRRYRLLTYGRTRGQYGAPSTLDFRRELSASQFHAVSSAVSNVVRTGDPAAVAGLGHAIGADRAFGVPHRFYGAGWPSEGDVCAFALSPSSGSDEVDDARSGSPLCARHVRKLFDALDESRALLMFTRAIYGNIPPYFVPSSTGPGGWWPPSDYFAYKSASHEVRATPETAGFTAIYGPPPALDLPRRYGVELEVCTIYHVQMMRKTSRPGESSTPFDDYHIRTACVWHSVPLAETGSDGDVYDAVVRFACDGLDAGLSGMGLSLGVLPAGVSDMHVYSPRCFFFARFPRTSDAG